MSDERNGPEGPEGPASQGLYPSSWFTASNDHSLQSPSCVHQPGMQQYGYGAEGDFVQPERGFVDSLSGLYEAAGGDPELQMPESYPQSFQQEPIWDQGEIDLEYIEPAPDASFGCEASPSAGRYQYPEVNFGDTVCDKGLTSLHLNNTDPTLLLPSRNGLPYSTQAHTGPWSPLRVADPSQLLPYGSDMRTNAWECHSDVAGSTCASNFPGSHSMLPGGSGTPITSVTDANNLLVPRNQVAIPYPSDPWERVSPAASTFGLGGPFGDRIEINIHEPSISANPLGSRATYPHSEPGTRLPVPVLMVRRSSVSSQTTESSFQSIETRFLPDVLECGVAGCDKTFRGTYRRGNLQRHMRTVHADSVYECEEPTCTKVFKRSDARRKHYKKHHPWLAADSLSSSRSNGSRSSGGNQEGDFNYMAGWST